jgi:antitoxin PrlF
VEGRGLSKEQLALPKTARKALRAAEGDLVGFFVEDGRSTVATAASDDTIEDPAVAAFLATLEESLATARPFPVELMRRMRELTADIEVDLDQPIEDDVVI